tara:strand:+ start:1990 stop:3027 length:1038 start_codon:yes stop_codon:yes gene_type:complete
MKSKKTQKSNIIKIEHFKFLLIISIILLSSFQNETILNQINTVQGSINSSELGVSLTHEHIMSNFGKDITESLNYDTVELFNQVIPYLKQLKSYGVNSIFDCTTKHFGRRVDLLKIISDSTGIQIITNTGIYGAANDRYVPEFVYNASAKSISEIWINEFENGIEGTKIRPGFIKLAFDNEALPSNIDKKLFEAGILTHLETGLTLAVHNANNVEAVKYQIELLDEYNIHPSAWIWTHANKVEDDTILIDIATKGAWISLDGIKESNTEEYIKRIRLFKQKNLLNKILLSHDGNGYPKGGKIRKFHAVFENLIPVMLKRGFTHYDINQIMVENPKEAFGIRIRKK